MPHNKAYFNILFGSEFIVNGYYYMKRALIVLGAENMLYGYTAAYGIF